VLDATAWTVIDARTGEALASRGADRRLPIASATKLMTAYLTLAELPLTRQVRAVPYAAIPGESLLGLTAGERVSVRDLLYGLILASGNDAAVTLASAVSGSEPAFVRQMNVRASALGLSDTHYSNPIGLDEPGNYSSAADLVALGRRLLGGRAFRRISDTEEASLPSLDPPETIPTRNTLLLGDPSATGIKTGHTLGAGYVLVGSARRDGVELISAVLGASSELDRDIETSELLDYGFSLYRQRGPVRAGRSLARVDIRYTDEALPLVASRNVRLGVRKDQRIEVSIQGPEEVTGPIRKGAKLGMATVTVDGRRVARVPLRAGRQVSKASVLTRAQSVAGDWIAVILIAASAIMIGVFVARRRRRLGKAEKEEDILISREQRRSERECQRREREEGSV